MEYLKNCWYVAAWDDEVKAGQLLARTLLDRPVALYRGEDGVARALADRCPHRFAPLTRGTVCGNVVRCGYHGLEFGPNGVCTRNPHGNGAIPSGARVQSYPLHEKYSLLWIWMGDPPAADPSTIPDFSSLNPEDRIAGKGYLLAPAHYQLEVDNIMDLSHIDYLHQGSLGAAQTREAETRVDVQGGTVWSYRLSRNECLSPELERRNGLTPGTVVDRWLDVRWNAPGVMELRVGHALAGSRDPRSSGKERIFVHLFTPESARSTHYWFGSSLPRSMGPAAEAAMVEMVDFLRKPFESEDLPMLEAQQRTMGEVPFWSLRPILLSGDAAAVRARRLLDEMIVQEGQLEDR